MALPPNAQEPPAPDPTELPEGTRLLDRYTIIDRVGSGGMASIYRAMDDRLDRVVCVKLLRLVVEGSGSTAGGSVYQATYSHFLQEALALSRLQHPNTLRIYDFGYLDGPTSGRPFQISEYLDGGNLEGRVRRIGPLVADEIEKILERITGAITEAHEQRIIHRDIKPSNILFARIGAQLVPKLADFGIAQSELKKQKRAGQTDDAGPDPVSTVALFSPRWAAPEQLCGAPEGPYTDVYALGLITMFMLTGRVPFDDHDARATFNARVRSDDLVRQRLRDRQVEGAINTALMAAMAADPNARIRSAADFFTRIRDALQAPRIAQAPIRPRMDSESVTVELEGPAANDANDGEVQRTAPSEREVRIGRYRVRIAQVHEMLDFTRAAASSRTGAPMEVRFRVTMLPTTNAAGQGPSPLRINVKGLNCFVAWADGAGRPTPAIVASQDGTVDLISSTRERIGRISWSFGTPTHTGRLFLVDGQELVIPYSEATHAVVVHVGDDRELVAVCKRS